jgi:LPS sulfotransferase NodH
MLVVMLKKPMREWLATNYYTLMFAGLNGKVLAGRRDYTRFIVLGRPRTGSTFLRSALNGHRQLFTFGELFRHDLISREPHLGGLSDEALADYSKRPLDFIQERVFRTYPAQIRAVGFKIFYHHAHNEYSEPIWSYLLGDQSIHVIHVKRRNLLKTFVSHKVAWLTGTWKQTSESAQTVPSVALTFEECEVEFRTATAQEAAFDARFGKHPLLNVVYEDLVKNFTPEMARIQDFLGVEQLVLRPTTVQQGKRPLAEQVVNYYELKERFQHTPWAHFFTE